jgi:hypothetical protein
MEMENKEIKVTEGETMHLVIDKRKKAERLYGTRKRRKGGEKK